jgi:hypothetical protein
MWTFCLRSLFREYGWRFAAKVAVRHPIRTLRGFREAANLDATGGGIVAVGDPTAGPPAGPPPVVGAGFCLKPVTPPCPSGRANHDCACLEHHAELDPTSLPAPCGPCAIRAIGTDALRAGAAFYVMTSAGDILDDVFVPAMAGKGFTTGLFVMCRYSFRPFALGLLASGMGGQLLPLGGGDCRDYQTWLLADRGIKADQTTVDVTGMRCVTHSVGGRSSAEAWRVERRGNVLFPLNVGGDRVSVASDGRGV